MLFSPFHRELHLFFPGIVDPNLGVSRGTSLILSAALSSGDALPGWLHFEPLRAAFWGTPPYVEDAGQQHG